MISNLRTWLQFGCLWFWCKCIIRAHRPQALDKGNTQMHPSSGRIKQWLSATGFCFPVTIEFSRKIFQGFCSRVVFSVLERTSCCWLWFIADLYCMPASVDDPRIFTYHKTNLSSPENKNVVTLLYFTFFLGFLLLLRFPLWRFSFNPMKGF